MVGRENNKWDRTIEAINDINAINEHRTIITWLFIELKYKMYYN